MLRPRNDTDKKVRYVLQVHSFIRLKLINREDCQMYLVIMPFLVARILNSAMMKENNTGYCRDLYLVYCCVPAMTQIRRSGLWYRFIFLLDLN